VTQKETRSEQPGPFSLFNEASAGLALTAKKQFDEFAKAQAELLDAARDANQWWFDRFRAEANLASEFTSKLTAARSIPDAMTTYQEWSTRHFEMTAEDAKHLLDDTQKFLQMGTRVFANGWQSQSPA
jgi:hypothetical protein